MPQLACRHLFLHDFFLLLQRMVKLSLIIATYNRSEQLLVALQSLTAQTASAKLWECIVVDNNSTDDTQSVFNTFATRNPSLNIRIVTETKQGLSHARNRGIAESCGDYIAIIDDDEHVNSDFIRAYTDLFDSHPEYSVAGGRVVAEYPDGIRPPQISPLIEQALANPMDYGPEIREFPSGKIPAGGNMAFRRDILIRYDCFNSSLGRTGKQLTGGEECYLFERMAADGIKFIYVPDAIIWHVIPQSKLSLDYLRRLAFGTGISQYRRAKLHGKVARLWFAEFIKWIATLLLAVGYTLKLQPEKGKWLTVMRLYTTRGIMKKE